MTASLINSAGVGGGYPLNLDIHLSPCMEHQFKMDLRFKCKPKTMKTLEENTRKMLLDMGPSKMFQFLDKIPKEQGTKAKTKTDYTKEK